MKPEHCGFGRSLESLTPGDRIAVEGFKAFLEGRVALTADGRDYVAFSDPRAAIAGCGCRWERTGRGVKFTVRCERDTPMCRTLERWEHEILGGAV